jgi:glycosyltransferase involved in cell wall biosynthesis
MLGARGHYAVPRLLHEAGLLERFFTDSYIGNKPWLEAGLRAIPAGTRPHAVQRWLGRRDDVLPPEKVTSFERLGLWYGHARQRASGKAAVNEVAREAAQRFNRSILKVGLGDAKIVWGFNGAAVELLEAAKCQGRLCVLEQTILPRVLERRMLADEQQRWPGWEKHRTDWTQPLAMEGREETEWELADAIVAGSEFVRGGLVEMGVSPGKIHVIPYGVEASRFGAGVGAAYPAHVRAGPLRVLFAGEVGLRKGVPDLLNAAYSFSQGEVEVRLAGGVSLQDEKLSPFQTNVEFLGAVPRTRMRELFDWADVFVLPSIVEGSATVIYEAIMAGCPVITTSNAGAIIQDGVDGFIVPIRSPERIAAALRRYIDDTGLLDVHRQALKQTSQRASLERYGRDLVRLIESLDQTPAIGSTQAMAVGNS